MKTEGATRVRWYCCWLLPSLVVISQVLPAEEPQKQPYRKTAIFVDNRAGPELNEKVTVLEDFLSSRVTEHGFSVINREVAVNALRSYPTAEISFSKSSAIDAKTGLPSNEAAVASQVNQNAANRVSSTSEESKLDRMLSDSTSALRLAQNLGADYILAASIVSLGSEKRTFEDRALRTVNVIHTLRVSYRVLEAAQGGSLIGDTVSTRKATRFTQNNQTQDSDLINHLLDEAAIQVAQSIARKKGNLATAAPAKPKLVEIIVSCGMTDLAQMPVSVPDIRVDENGALIVSTDRLGLQVMDATVEVNGTALGSAPGKFKVPPGLNKLRLSREGFSAWERTVNFSEGQKFNVALQMSEEGYSRWKDTTAFLFGLETGKKLTDGTVKMMEGFAKLLEQSGYRIDSRTEVKANIEAKGKSLFDGLTIQPTLFR